MSRAKMVLGLCGLAMVLSCSPADIAAEKKALADANARINSYCDARAKAIEVLSGDAGAKP